MLIILFGLAGSGKNYVGDILANHYNYYFWDADAALPPEMKQCIKEKKVFTQDMRDQFTAAMIEKIRTLQLEHKDLVIAQALYKEKNRNQLLTALNDAILIQIVANPEIIHQRLVKRFDEVDPSYADKISQGFEQPSASIKMIYNNSDQEHILKQLDQLFNVN